MKLFRTPFLLYCLVVFLSIPVSLWSQTPEQPIPCSTPEYRQMDFWIGDWEVKNPKGEIVGTNRIDQILGTCVLMENWKGKGGSNGHSFNIYNVQKQRWEQTWVDNSGSVIYFHGVWNEEAGQIAYFAEAVTRKNKPLLYRMIFTPKEDGSVNQLWEASTDMGQDWKTLFNGTYRKKK